MTASSALRANCHFLRQGAELLGRVAPDAYAASTRPGWAPVGAQFRHVLDHYQCFLQGLAGGTVDYDARRRDVAVEQDPAEAAALAERLARALEALEVRDGNRPVSVQMQTGAEEGVPDWRPSSLGRELQFLVSHTVHHYALIKLLLEDHGVYAGEEFGVAPSTLAFQRSGH
jgi:uncharacterized damage-inducible protein DinB